MKDSSKVARSVRSVARVASRVLEGAIADETIEAAAGVTVATGGTALVVIGVALVA